MLLLQYKTIFCFSITLFKFFRMTCVFCNTARFLQLTKIIN
ncbi:hypothetical protein SB444474_3592 [Shigella boydii 4444-74]|uniref:Uncharacterized protein n=1 Tax=Shigella boydii 4444-74 TaxID=766140 RepID=I6DQM0_SHIBO|nr:hypothetical protein SB444474_3592 [Shigella boydii 4444-74]